MNKDVENLIVNDYYDSLWIMVFLNSDFNITLWKLITIVKYCGYDFERYINNWVYYSRKLNSEQFEIIDDKNVKVDYNHLLLLEHLNKSEYLQFIKILERKGFKFFDDVDSYISFGEELTEMDKFCFREHYNFYKMLEDDSIRNSLISARRMTLIDLAAVDQHKYVDADYTYLIVNYVKSLEMFMFYKLNKIKRFSQDEVKYSTFGSLVKKIEYHINKLDYPKKLKKCYLDMLENFRDIYRNGYFHSDILARDDSYMTIEMAQLLILLTEIML